MTLAFSKEIPTFTEIKDAFECAETVMETEGQALTQKEYDFIESVLKQYNTKKFLSNKQIVWILSIYDDYMNRL